MLMVDDIERRGAEIADSPDLRALLARLQDRAGPVLARAPHLPGVKALLSTDGGRCPADGAALRFDPWSPHEHRCAVCGAAHEGDRHHRHWARGQHLWLAERAAHLATVGVFAGNDAAAGRAAEILRAYGDRYGELPNRDNVLGPGRLFFSTYLESVWLTSYVSAAMLLRESGRLDDETGAAVSRVVDEAAGFVAEFNEGFSNRQTWHNAALAAIGVWFEDEELARRAIETETGLLNHLLHGFGSDGMWYEGENYHLFALRGLLVGIGWARQAGVDALGDPVLAERLRAALAAPTLSALPDFTFPARKDSRFGISLAQPMYLELWEVGLARLAEAGHAAADLGHWLAALYDVPAPEAEPFDSYLHEAGEEPPCGTRTRADLSWWSLLEMAPTLDGDAAAWRPDSALLASQGLAVLREGGRYASLECGRYGGGHGHPDRLHLTLFADGVHWLPDFGTGSYVARDLFWYRSTLAHNAPRLDGRSQAPGDAVAEAFEAHDGWGWARGRFGELARTVVSGPDYLLDIVELNAADPHVLELPWHLQGVIEIASAGRWESATLDDDFARDVERFVPADPAAVLVRVHATPDGRSLALRIHFEGDLLRAVAPGPPGSAAPQRFLVARAQGRYARVVSVIASGAEPPELAVSGETIVVRHGGAEHRHRGGAEAWDIEGAGPVVRLRGARAPERARGPLLNLERPVIATAAAPHVTDAPALDGSLAGFDTGEPLGLDHEDHYFRSEEPFAGPEVFSATAFVNWNADGLFVAVEVAKPEVLVRPAGAEPLRLDNEPDDIHSDGLQVYVQRGAAEVGGAFEIPAMGWLVVPDAEGDGLRVHAVAGTAATDGAVSGGWQRTESGYRITLAVRLPELQAARPRDELRFDLIVNEMREERLRRAGQLVWSGGGGWVWLRGDRQDPARFGALRLLA